MTLLPVKIQISIGPGAPREVKFDVEPARSNQQMAIASLFGGEAAWESRANS